MMQRDFGQSPLQSGGCAPRDRPPRADRGDMHRLARQAHGGEHPVEQPPRRARQDLARIAVIAVGTIDQHHQGGLGGPGGGQRDAVPCRLRRGIGQPPGQKCLQRIGKRGRGGRDRQGGGGLARHDARRPYGLGRAPVAGSSSTSRSTPASCHQSRMLAARAPSSGAVSNVEIAPILHRSMLQG